MEKVLTDFVKALRNSNVRVSPAETLDAMSVIDEVGYDDRELLKRSLSIVLPKTPDEKQKFETCFDDFFTDEIKEQVPVALKELKDIEDVNVSIDNGNKKTKDNISSPFVTSPFNETQVENHNEVENYSLGLDQNTQDIENSKIYTPITKITPSSTRPLRTSALNESPAVAINSYQEKSQPHNNKDIKKQLRVTYDAVQQMVAAEHAASSSIRCAI